MNKKTESEFLQILKYELKDKKIHFITKVNWSILKHKHYGSEIFNFNEIIENLLNEISFEELNKIEEKWYENLNDTERKWIICKNIQKILEYPINTYIMNDIAQRSTDLYKIIAFNLDSLYDLNMPHIKKDDEMLNKIFPKQKDFDLSYKILKINIIITTLHRVKGIILYTKLNDQYKNTYSGKLLKEINFTKGYLVCIYPDLYNKIKNLKYYRKEILPFSKNVTCIKNIKKIKEIYNNKNFSQSIWIDDLDLDYSKYKIYNNVLENEIKSFEFLEILNILNNTKIKYNRDIFNTIYNIISDVKVIKPGLINKNTFKNQIYYINKQEQEQEQLTIEEGSLNLLDINNSIFTIELIKEQLERYKYFYFNYFYDSRTRIYVKSWPVNYQLNHIVRNVVEICGNNGIENVIKKFYENDLVKRYLIEGGGVV